MQYNTIQFGKNTVTKTAAPDLMRVEVEKTQRAFKIGNECGLFRVPKVLDHDEVKGTAVFERLNIRPMWQEVRWGAERIAFAKILGTSLAIIHREMTLPYDMCIPLPVEFASSHGEVFVHGDLGLGNVCVGPFGTPITIIDWQMTPVFGGRGTYGPRYFDILWFVHSLIHRPCTRFIYSNPVAPVARALIESYSQEAGVERKPEVFAAYAVRFFDVVTPRYERHIRETSKGRARLLLPFCEKISRAVVESLKPREQREMAPSTKTAEAGMLTMDYRESHLDANKGESYHASFSKDPYRNMMWQFEKGILDRVISTFLGSSKICHLDFACGTARILSYLEKRADKSVGVDLSPSMLEAARKNIATAEIIEADLTLNDVLGSRKFNLITAFRFFPNAQPELRRQVMVALARHLDDSGYLVFNNHKNTGSTRNLLARLCGRRGYQGMSISEVKALLFTNSLQIARIYHVGVLPASEKHKLLPLFILRPVESLLSKCWPLRSLGENLVFVCRRQQSGTRSGNSLPLSGDRIPG